VGKSRKSAGPERLRLLRIRRAVGRPHAAAISLYPDETRETAELGWITNKAYWGHGIAFEAVQAVLRFAADELHIHRFIAHCDTENTASFRFMEKLGMTRIAEYGGRHNKGSDEERREYEYELKI